MPKPSFITTGLFIFLRRFPVLFNLSSQNDGLLSALYKAMADISKTLFEKAKKEKEEGHLDGKEESSVIGLLSALFAAAQACR